MFNKRSNDRHKTRACAEVSLDCHKMLFGALCLYFFSVFVGAVEIVGNPQTIPNATLGGSASFDCILSSESVIPSWNINGTDYSATRLPQGVYFEKDSFSNVLTINPVTQEMNNSCIYCYLVFIAGRMESLRAKLIIQPPIPSYSISTNILSTASPTLTSAVSTTSHYLPHATTTTSSELSNTGDVTSNTKRGLNSLIVGGSTTTVTSSAKSSSQNEFIRNMTSNTKRNLNPLLVGVSTAVAVTALIITLVAFTLLIWGCYRKKGSSSPPNSSKEYPVYEEVAVPESPVVHNNPAYETPGRMRIERNPAYIERNPAYISSH